MQIRPIAASDGDFSAWFEVYLSARLADYPSGPQWRENELSVIYEGSEHHAARLWLAEEDGKAVGAAVMGLPLRDNTSLGEPEIHVRPEKRRRGIASALLDVLRDAALADGRTSLLTHLEGPTSSTSAAGHPYSIGTAFAEHHGFSRRITEIARAQRTPFDFVAIEAAETAAADHAGDYRIVTWRDRVPDEYVHEYARLEGRLSTDAPIGDLDYEGEMWDEARVRSGEARRVRMGRGAWMAAAVTSDRNLAGITRITMAADSDDAGFQDSTLVDPAHRGHRLGLLLKAANVRTLHRDRPGVQTVWTWNADSNTHMIAINETLGYAVEGWDAAYQLTIG